MLQILNSDGKRKRIHFDLLFLTKTLLAGLALGISLQGCDFNDQYSNSNNSTISPTSCQIRASNLRNSEATRTIYFTEKDGRVSCHNQNSGETSEFRTKFTINLMTFSELESVAECRRLLPIPEFSSVMDRDEFIRDFRSNISGEEWINIAYASLTDSGCFNQIKRRIGLLEREPHSQNGILNYNNQPRRDDFRHSQGVGSIYTIPLSRTNIDNDNTVADEFRCLSLVDARYERFEPESADSSLRRCMAIYIDNFAQRGMHR
jgi:hypothetical protein